MNAIKFKKGLGRGLSSLLGDTKSKNNVKSILKDPDAERKICEKILLSENIGYNKICFFSYESFKNKKNLFNCFWWAIL